jgi:hypothetical protein
MLQATAICTGLLFALAGDLSGTSPDIKTYESLKAKASSDSQSQVKLALWCEAHGLNAERVKHLARAVLADPTNVTARGLMGLVAVGGRWKSTDEIGDRLRTDSALAARLAEYEKRRSRLTADEIDSEKAAELLEKKNDYNTANSVRLKNNRRLALAHVTLGKWCESEALSAEAAAHYTMAVHLDPSRDLNWKRLGYTRRNGRWTSPEQAAALAHEAAAQKKADHAWEPRLRKWTSLLRDPARAVEGERLLTTVTDRRAIPSILKLLPLDRPEADQILRVSLLAQIDDPTSSRAIADQAVSTQLDSVRRAAIKVLKKRPLQDYAGQLVERIRGIIQYTVQPLSGPDSRGALAIDAPRFRIVRTYDVPPAFELAPTFRGYVGYDDNGLPVVAQGIDLDFIKRNSGNPLAVAQRIHEIEVRTANMLAQATQAAQRQMAEDIYQIETTNEQAIASNKKIVPVLTAAAGASESLGYDEDAWRSWWYDSLGYSYQAAPKPTFAQGSVPQYYPYEVRTCFAAGTPVHTLTGERPIEAIQIGDQVLAQDGATGALSYQAVVYVHRNPPAKTLRITLSDGESVVCSIYHRFWRANLGWAQARELKPGDSLRSLSGIVRISGIEPDEVQPLFNLDVVRSKTFFAGKTVLLVHDNTLPDHRLEPFDKLPVVDSSKHLE